MQRKRAKTPRKKRTAKKKVAKRAAKKKTAKRAAKKRARKRNPGEYAVFRLAPNHVYWLHRMNRSGPKFTASQGGAWRMSAEQANDLSRFLDQKYGYKGIYGWASADASQAEILRTARGKF